MNPHLSSSDISATKNVERHICEYCLVETDPDFLWVHEPTTHKLCQVCLAKFLATDIEDSEDHKGHFMNFVFAKASENWSDWIRALCGGYTATNDLGEEVIGNTMDEVLEGVLMYHKQI